VDDCVTNTTVIVTTVQTRQNNQLPVNKVCNWQNAYLGNTLQPTAVKSFSSHAPILNRQKRNATNANSWPTKY